MSDSEDDYMSDKLLQVSEDVRPGLVFNRTTKRQYELEKKKQEIQAKKPKNHAEREQELREQGLNTAISSDNKGFKMLEKMGFKQGQGLGKTQSGLTEPIKIELKSGKSGIGVKTHIKEKIQKKKAVNDESLMKKMNDFQFNIKAKQARRFLEKDFNTAQKACEDLDCRNDIDYPIQDFFWTKDTIMKKRNIDEEDLDEFNEEFLSYITEENLTEIIHYLRSKYLYCIFCAFVASDEEDLNTNCPGAYRSDHDDG